MTNRKTADIGASIHFQGVSKHYGSVVALDDLDLTIEPGEFVSLLGPSGSGKSTTLNILAGLIRPQTGKVFVGATDVTHLSPDKRDIAMVFQNYALYPHMTVAENLAFPLKARIRRKSRSEIDIKVREVAETLGIDALLGRYPREISGGQQQRVALGRATVRDPKVFLLDEPLSNLDARLRLKMRHDLKTLHQQLRSTIVYVTHDQGEAMSLSDRIAIYQNGRLQQFSTPLEIYKNPVNLFVANFMGEREMTNLEGRVVSSGLGFGFETEGVGVALPTGSEWSRFKDRPTVLGIRPDGVRLASDDEEDALKGRLSITEQTGDEQVIYINVNGIEICGKAPADMPLAAGDPVAVKLDPKEIYLFDLETGQAISWGGKMCSDS